MRIPFATKKEKIDPLGIKFGTSINNRINDIAKLCTGYEKKVTNVYENRKRNDKVLQVQNRLYNPQRNIGTSRDILSQYRVLEDYSDSYHSLQILRGLDIAPTVIQLPSMIALKGKIAIDTGNEELNEEIANELKRLKYKSVLSRALMYSKISSYGCVVAAITNAGDQMSPLSNGEEILAFNVVADHSFFYSSYHAMSEVWKENYHTPTRIFIGGIEADKSRFHHSILDYDVYTTRGRNILQENLGSLMALNMLELAYSHQLVQSQFKLVKYPSDRPKSVAGPKLKQDLESLLSHIKDTATTQDFIAFPDDFQLEFVNLTAPDGLRNLNDYFVTHLSMSSQIPELILRGGSAGALATSYENTKQFYTLLHSREQKILAEPILRFMVDSIIKSKGYSTTEYSIVFDPIYVPTERERLENELLALQVEAEKNIAGEVDEEGEVE